MTQPADKTGETPKQPGETPNQQPPVGTKDAEVTNKPTLDGETFDPDRAMDTIRKLREENKSLKTRAKRVDELEQAEQDRKQAEMSEADKLKAKLEAAEKAKDAAIAQANERLIRSELVAKASVLNFADPTDAVALVDKSKIEIKDDGSVSGVDDALKELLKAKPHLVKRGAPPQNPTNPGAGTGSGETDAQRRARLYGSAGADIFNPAKAVEKGGGVIFSQKGD